MLCRIRSIAIEILFYIFIENILPTYSCKVQSKKKILRQIN